MPRNPRLRVVLCRGCCCGTRRAKASGFDHRAQARALELAVAGNPDAELRTVDCLDFCARANVVVVSGAASTGRPTWLGDMLDPRATQELCEWIAAGGVDDLPALLAAHEMDPRRPTGTTRRRRSS